MPRNDKLYEESRIIRKAANEGKTTSEIMQMLSLTSAQIKYRVETRYTEKVAGSIIKRLDENDKGIRAKEEAQKTTASQNAEEFSQSKLNTDAELNNAIVVDTCALKYKGAFEFIMSYETVILLVDIVKQLDNHKDDAGIFGRNIRALLKESAEDQEEKKIKITTAGEPGDSADSKLLAFCKGKNLVLYTADNGLATLAKWFKIKYILAKDLDKTESSNKEEKCEDLQADLKQIDLAELKKQMQENSITAKQTAVSKCSIKNVSLLGKFLSLTIPETSKIKYLVIAGDKVKYPVCSNIIHLNKGDNVVIATYKLAMESLSISRYEITDVLPEEHAIYLGTDKVKEAWQIEKLDLPNEAKRELKSYFSLVKK